MSELVAMAICVALEGFTHLIPFAAAHEIIRQGRKDLVLVRLTPDLIFDQMIGMGCARALTFSWGGNPGVGSLHRLRDAIEHGWPRPLEIDEHSHAGLTNRYVAGASALPFAVMRGYVGTDLMDRSPTISMVECPFTGEKLAAVRAIRPDVAVVHAQQADHKGNAAALGYHWRAKRGRARLSPGPCHSRRGRRRARAEARGRAAAVLGRDSRLHSPRAALVPPTRSGTTSATTISTSHGTRSAGSAVRSLPGCRRKCLERWRERC